MYKAVSQVTAVPAGSLAGALIPFVAFPSNAIIKHVDLWMQGSYSLVYGEVNIANLGGNIPQISGHDNAFYGAVVTVQRAGTDLVGDSSSVGIVQPAWQSAGLAADPGGSLVLSLKLGAAVANAVVLYCTLEYVE